MEIIFLSASLMFSVGAHSADDAQGIVFTIFLLAVVANEVAVGLALLIAYTRKYNISKLSFLNLAKG
jgi:NADH:ubiquinone oxidoreductase subunit K